MASYPPYTKDQTLRILEMMAINAAHLRANPCHDCNSTGLTPERYDCHCRATLPFTADQMERIVTNPKFS